MEPFDPLPQNLAATRTALHRLATYVIAPVRHQATGRFGLRATDSGFGTPTFDGRRIRVHGLDLIDEPANGPTRTSPITTLSAAADFLGTVVDAETAAEGDSPPVGDVDADLEIEKPSSLWLGRWFGAAFDALGQVRADDESVEGSEPQLWPGHFDPAIEIGDENHRGSYGASPGDDAIAEPYLYLSVWWPDRLNLNTQDPKWNSSTFTGSVLRVSDFPSDRNPVEVASEFWRDARDRLAAG